MQIAENLNKLPRGRDVPKTSETEMIDIPQDRVQIWNRAVGLLLLTGRMEGEFGDQSYTRKGHTGPNTRFQNTVMR